MLSFIVQAGYATTAIDFTTDLSSLMVGLVALTALSAGMIAFAAVRYHFVQKAEAAPEMTPAMVAYQQAA
jgi:hypothetical protein